MKNYSRHLLFCTGSDCNGKKLFKAAREILGKDSVHIKRSKVSCLGACKLGPIMIVYPDGIWYRCPNKKALNQIIEQHIKNGMPVQQYMIHKMPIQLAGARAQSVPTQSTPTPAPSYEYMAESG